MHSSGLEYVLSERFPVDHGALRRAAFQLLVSGSETTRSR